MRLAILTGVVPTFVGPSKYILSWLFKLPVVSKVLFLFLHIVTDLINALPGNRSLNTVQHATIEEAVFSVSSVTSRSGGYGHVICVRSSAI
jgi:hypothetical protein